MPKTVILFVTVFMLTFSSASAGHKDKFSIDEATTVDEAVDRISSILEGQGFEIIARINHAAAAASVDLELRPTTVIFASHPLLDLRLLRRRQIAALDLPFKFLFFEDGNGKVHLEFNDEGFLVDRHRIPQRDRFLHLLDAVLNQFGRLDNGVVKVASKQSVDDTVDTLLELLEERGFRIPIPGGIDFNERSGKRGFKLRPTKLIIFGNPLVGTPLMQNDQSIGLDLPQKFLVFEKRDGRVFIAFNAPAFLARKHNLQRDVDPILDTRLENITNALMGLAELAANPQSP